MVSGAIWGCTGFTGDSGASRLAFFPLDSAVNVILMLVLGKRKVHLQRQRGGELSPFCDVTKGEPNPARARRWLRLPQAALFGPL